LDVKVLQVFVAHLPVHLMVHCRVELSWQLIKLLVEKLASWIGRRRLPRLVVIVWVLHVPILRHLLRIWPYLS